MNKHLNAGIQSDYVFFDEVVLFLMYIICKKKEGKKKGNVLIFIYNGVERINCFVCIRVMMLIATFSNTSTIS
jgi:hypothetical protein